MRGVTAWAHRCRIPEFTTLARTLSRYKDSIHGHPGRRPVKRSGFTLHLVLMIRFRVWRSGVLCLLELRMARGSDIFGGRRGRWVHVSFVGVLDWCRLAQ